jgi:hypothetical protein
VNEEMEGEDNEVKYLDQPHFNEGDEIGSFVVAWEPIASFYAGIQYGKVLNFTVS